MGILIGFLGYLGIGLAIVGIGWILSVSPPIIVFDDKFTIFLILAVGLGLFVFGSIALIASLSSGHLIISAPVSFMVVGGGLVAHGLSRIRQRRAAALTASTELQRRYDQNGR